MQKMPKDELDYVRILEYVAICFQSLAEAMSGPFERMDYILHDNPLKRPELISEAEDFIPVVALMLELMQRYGEEMQTYIDAYYADGKKKKQGGAA